MRGPSDRNLTSQDVNIDVRGSPSPLELAYLLIKFGRVPLEQTLSSRRTP